MSRTPFRITAFFWAMLIAGLSLMPGDLAPQSGFGDKVEHILGYAILASLIATGWRHIPAAVFIAISYGALIELLQNLTGDRIMDGWDATANAAGAIAGCACLMLVRQFAFNRQR